MDEQRRLQELEAYKILDTADEIELDEIAEIASAICDTPISLMTLVDDKRQWFKAIIGLDIKETPRRDAFCQYALNKPAEVLVVDDPLSDERFKRNPLVLGNPGIRFYAGAPLTTSNGLVLGTLCVIDIKPRAISESQKKALMLLAKKAMDYLETRKLLIEQRESLEINVSKLKRLSDQAPGVIFQLEKTSKEFSFLFVSEGIKDICSTMDSKGLNQSLEKIFNVIHPDDLVPFRESLQSSYIKLGKWSHDFRVLTDEGSICWYTVNAQPEMKAGGTVVWYGAFQDIKERKKYTETLELILFDISHVMRRPVATLLGLTTAIGKLQLDEITLREFSRHIQSVSLEMDGYIRKLHEVYYGLYIKDSTESNEPIEFL